MNRAYSLLTVKSVDDDKRILEGIASTPTPDRMDDIVELDGMEFKLPLPFLYQHNSRQPIGTVISAKKTAQGLFIRVQIAAQGIASFIDEAWSLIKAGLVKGFSIGFRGLETSYMADTGGIRFIRSELFEISAVTIPANAEATITSVKSADALSLAASGNKARGTTTVHIPGASGATEKKNMTIQEQITQFENKRAAAVARIKAIMDKAGEAGSTLDATEAEEHDNCESEIKQIDDHLIRLRKHQDLIVATAAPVTHEGTADPARAAATRGGAAITVTSQVPKGVGFARAMIALAACNGNRFEAAAQAKKHWPDMGEALEMVIKAEQLPGTVTGTTWASPLMQSSQRLVGEFIELLRPATIIGRIPNLRRVPFNVTVPVQSGGGTYGWVGENAPKAVSGLSLTTAVLRQTKIAGIIPYTKEALRLSDPSIEVTVRNDMIKGVAAYQDAQFVDPSVHDSIGVNPPSITDQIVNVVASGLTGALFIDDMTNIISKMIVNNQSVADLVILMSESVALNLSSKRTSLGARLFPEINVQGGNYNGIPIITSQNVGARVILLNPTQILLAEDPGVTIDVSEEASVVMTTTPASSPAATSLVSFWQNNLIGLRVEQFITWKRAMTAAVEYISSAVYSGTT
jgi:HK97 family phage prohead protease/HK97 family phage major capsid protein